MGLGILVLFLYVAMNDSVSSKITFSAVEQNKYAEISFDTDSAEGCIKMPSNLYYLG